MKLLFTLLLPFTISAQSQFVTCPLTLSFPQDSTQEVWGLQSAGVTEWQQVCQLLPDANSKESWEYKPWVPTNSNPVPQEEVLVLFLATQNKQSRYYGTVESRGYYCAYTFRNKIKK